MPCHRMAIRGRSPGVGIGRRLGAALDVMTGPPASAVGPSARRHGVPAGRQSPAEGRPPYEPPIPGGPGRSRRRSPAAAATAVPRAAARTAGPVCGAGPAGSRARLPAPSRRRTRPWRAARHAGQTHEHEEVGWPRPRCRRTARGPTSGTRARPIHSAATATMTTVAPTMRRRSCAGPAVRALGHERQVDPLVDGVERAVDHLRGARRPPRRAPRAPRCRRGRCDPRPAR